MFFFFFSSRRRHTRWNCDWSSDVCSSDLDVGQHATLSDGNSRQQFIQFLVVTDGQLQMTWDDSRLLVVTSSISCQLENFSSQIFHDGSQVDWSSSTNALSVVSLAKKTMDTTDWELKASTV